MIGDREELAFEFFWDDSIDPERRGLGYGGLVLWFAGEPHWPGDARRPESVCWTWIDLVEHIARAWWHLQFESVAPYGLVADDPLDLRSKKRLRSVQGVEPVEVEDAVHCYQHRHDLAAGLKGISLPSIWLLPEGTLMRVRASTRDRFIDMKRALDILEGAVQEISDFVGDSEGLRARAAFERWNMRGSVSEAKLMTLRTGLDSDTLEEWTPQKAAAEEFWGSPFGRETALMTAARLSRPLPQETRAKIVEAVATLTTAPELDDSPVAAGTPMLDTLGAEATSVLSAIPDLEPYEQGYGLALWLRQRLEVGDAPFDPAYQLSQWGVGVHQLPPVDSTLDAIACWGNVIPSVLYNPAGTHAQSPAGLRATLAHEIAHLLVDRNRNLPAGEVLGGATPKHLEQRARAFAAELLLPRVIASTAVAAHDSLDAAREEVQGKYGVSAELLGWQIRNGPGWHLLTEPEKRQVQRWRKQWGTTG